MMIIRIIRRRRREQQTIEVTIGVAMLRSEQDGLPELVSRSVPAKGCLGCGDITGFGDVELCPHEGLGKVRAR